MRVDKDLIAGILREMFSPDMMLVQTDAHLNQIGLSSPVTFQAFSAFLARRLDAVLVTQAEIAIAKKLLEDMERAYLNKVGEVEDAIIKTQERCLHPVMKSRVGVLPGQVEIVTCQICGKILKEEICPV
jgi:hypothetical protein